ncbi:hypothetical protein N9421_00430 [bacterium]|jgi:hypothetical protein|nr:hypothetical protein [bacterium]
MNKEIKSEDIIFNYFKQMCDEKDDLKCVELGKNWIELMKTNLTRMENNLKDVDKVKYKDDIQKNRQHLNELKDKNSTEWREYAKQCMIEISENKK